MLLEAEANINIQNKVTEQYYNIMSSEYVNVFLNNCSSTAYTQRGQTAVYYASAEGHSEVVKLLVQAGADLELQHKVCNCVKDSCYSTCCV